MVGIRCYLLNIYLLSLQKLILIWLGGISTLKNNFCFLKNTCLGYKSDVTYVSFNINKEGNILLNLSYTLYAMRDVDLSKITMAICHVTTSISRFRVTLALNYFCISLQNVTFDNDFLSGTTHFLWFYVHIFADVIFNRNIFFIVLLIWYHFVFCLWSVRFFVIIITLAFAFPQYYYELLFQRRFHWN